MPVEFDPTITPMTQREFHQVDYQVMELAFAVHNSLGRLCDELIYQNELAYECSRRFDAVAVEEPVTVSFRDFRKSYSMDMLVNHGALFELKSAAAITPQHRKQTLQYLLLTELQHGKIVNFRPSSVSSEFVSTHLNKIRRHDFAIDDDGWHDLCDESEWLRTLTCELLDDWGAFLDTQLFYEAIYHFRGGPANVVDRIELFRHGRPLGTQRAHLLDHDTAFTISAVTRDPHSYERHLRRFLALTKLHGIHWINFNHHQITFKTITQEEKAK